MPNVTMPNSQSAPQPDNHAAMMGGQQPGQQKGQGGVPPGKPGGDIMISQAEAVALTALETDDPKIAFKRAKAESGMSDNQLRKLQARARRARAAGYTLKGASIVLRPTNHAVDTPQGHGLATERQDGADDETDTDAKKPAKGAKPAAKGKTASKKTKEAEADELVEAAYFHIINDADRSVEDELKEMWAQTKSRTFPKKKLKK